MYKRQDLFFHLIDNAMKYRGKEDPIVKIECETQDDSVAISISDNGIGIDQRDIDSVFTIFKRLGYKDDVPGAGVGLAICRRIILRHHGELSLQKPRIGGTTLQFTLRPSPSATRAPQSVSANIGGSSNGSRT